MFEAFYFNQDQLFGCYHPASDHAAHRGAVICAPVFDDYRRSYRAMVELANGCSRLGMHVLRFDYFGTGDSSGKLEDADIGRWRADIDSAIEEMIGLTGVDEIVLVGIRLGATMASNSRHPCVKRMVFWDPVASGQEYLRWLEQVDEELKRESIGVVGYTGARLDDIAFEYFHLEPEFRKTLAALQYDPGVVTNVITSQVSLVESGTFSGCEFGGVEHDWPYYYNGILTPKPVLECIAEKILSS